MSRIPSSEIERIKSSISLIDWVRGQGYVVKKQGKDFSLSCPFQKIRDKNKGHAQKSH